MLQTIRERISGWVAGIILAMLALVFAVWGINFDFTARTVAAKVNGEDVPVEPVLRAYQDQLTRFQQSFRQDVPEPIQAEIRRSTIEQFVQRRLLEQRIEDAGYRVSDEALTRYIQAVPAFQVGGQFSRDAYRAALAGAGYSVQRFEEEQRRLLEIQQLQEGIVASSFVTDEELALRVAMERERRQVEWLSFPVERYAATVEVRDEEIAERYAATEDRWMTAETVDLAYIELDIDDLAAESAPDEERLRAYYEQERDDNPQRFSAPERRRASHILVSVDSDTAAAEAEERIRALAERIRGGAEFAEAAREASEDPGSAAQGGDLGWVERGVMVPAFEEALFALEPGTVSEPVKTEFGWHLIRVEEAEGGEVQSFEAAREELAAEYGRRQAEDRFFEMADRLAQLAFENSGSLEPAAEALGVPIGTVSGVTRDSGPGIAEEPAVREAAWSEAVLENRENSALLELDDEHAAVVRVTERHLPEQRPLESVSEEISAEIRREKAEARSRELAERAREQLAAGEPLEAVAKALEADFVGGMRIERGDASVPPAVVEAAYSAARPAGSPEIVTGAGPTGQFVVRVLDATPGELESLNEAERTELRTQLAQQQAGQELSAYLARLRDDAEVTVFEQALQ